MARYGNVSQRTSDHTVSPAIELQRSDNHEIGRTSAFSSSQLRGENALNPSRHFTPTSTISINQGYTTVLGMYNTNNAPTISIDPSCSFIPVIPPSFSSNSLWSQSHPTIPSADCCGFNAQIDNLQKIFEKNQDDHYALKKSIAERKSHYQVLSEALRQFKTKRDRLRNTLNRIQGEHDAIKERVAEHVNEVEMLKEDLSKAQSENDDLKNTNMRVVGEHNELKMKCASLHQSLLHLQQSF